MSVQATLTCFSAHDYPECGLSIRKVNVNEVMMLVVRRRADATSACQIEFGSPNQGPGGVQTVPCLRDQT